MSTEFEFTDRDFRQVVKMIYDRAGISLAEHKRDMVYSRLSRRLRKLGMRSFSKYLGLLDDPASHEWEAFTNALTTNLTAFFRESHHFDIMANHLREHRGSGEYTIWSLASSTGEEPYSAAMAALDVDRHLSRSVRILATDLDTGVLETGRTGIYPLDRVRDLGDDRLKKYFLRGVGANAGKAKIRPELAAMVTFRQLNLLSPNWGMKSQFDVIFCRNVMIYFDKPTQRRLLEKMAPLLKPHGLFFAGHSESLHHAEDLLRLMGQTTYRLARPR